MSSRNSYLSPEERQAAPILYQALQAGADAVRAGERDAENVRRLMIERIQSEPLARIDYVDVVDEATFRTISYVEGNIVLVGAIYIGSTRLIDNIPLAVPQT